MENNSMANLSRFSEILIASNRGPISIVKNENGEITHKRGSGGLVTALVGLANTTSLTWVACAMSPEDAEWKQGVICDPDNNCELKIHFVDPSPEEYDGYYNHIANPLLWFLQHSMWDVPRAPVIDQNTWNAWEKGYKAVNQQFAREIASQVKTMKKPVLIMLQDYHLYLAARYLKKYLRGQDVTISLFVHIPWPGPEYWGILPKKMRQEILDGLAAVDLLGFQTQEDGLNFIRTCENYLPNSKVSYRKGNIQYRSHPTVIRDYPISIDVNALKSLARTQEVDEYEWKISRQVGDRKMIVRVDRLEPSKNIIRGFQAYELLLKLHPEYENQVTFMAFLTPSRTDVEEYQTYLDEIMVTVGRINAFYGNSEWEPIRLMVGENYPKAIAAMKMYDVLLVNSITDGMNLVAKEGPMVNRKDGVLILSERAGAKQQLAKGSLVISPFDIFETQNAFHTALTLTSEKKKECISSLREIIEREDINYWLQSQMEDLIVIQNKQKKR